MNIKYSIILVSLILSLFILPGCGDPGQEGFPFMFGPTKMFDPITQPLDSGTNNVTIYVKDSDGDPIEGVSINIDGTTKIAYSSGYVYFYNLSPGRHLVKTSFDGWVEKITLLNLPGDGEDINFTITMQSSNDGGGDGGTPDDYEPNNTINDYYDITADFDWGWGYSDLSNTSVQLTDLYATIHNNEDEDYYRINILDNSSIYVRLKNIPAGCDYDIELLDWNGNHKTESTAGSSADETIYGYYILNGGYYHIRVYGSSNHDSANAYHLHIEVE